MLNSWAMTVSLAAVAVGGLVSVSLESGAGGPADRHVSVLHTGGAQQANPCAAAELGAGPRTRSAYAVHSEDAVDDGPSDDNAALAERLSEGGIFLKAGDEGPVCEHAGHARHLAIGIFQRCYGGQCTRAAPQPAG
jgi:hypothetical protein